MPVYIYQAAYTSASVAAQIKAPQNRIAHAREVIEGFGGKLIAGGHTFGEYDLVLVVEAPDDVAMGALALAIAAGGATRAAKTTPVMSGDQWVAALKAASFVGGTYRPVR